MRLGEEDPLLALPVIPYRRWRDEEASQTHLRSGEISCPPCWCGHVDGGLHRRRKFTAAQHARADNLYDSGDLAGVDDHNYNRSNNLDNRRSRGSSAGRLRRIQRRV